jgi:hypothetical protein
MEHIKKQFYQHVLAVKGAEFATELNDVMSFFDNVPYPQKKRARKAKRDPTRPKRPMNAFIAFTKAKRAEVTQANPEKKPKEILTLLGQLWKGTSSEDRKPYVSASESDMKRYLVAMQEWNKTKTKSACLVTNSENENEEQIREEKAKSRKPRKPRKPREPTASNTEEVSQVIVAEVDDSAKETVITQAETGVNVENPDSDDEAVEIEWISDADENNDVY